MNLKTKATHSPSCHMGRIRRSVVPCKPTQFQRFGESVSSEAPTGGKAIVALNDLLAVQLMTDAQLACTRMSDALRDVTLQRLTGIGCKLGRDWTDVELLFVQDCADLASGFSLST